MKIAMLVLALGGAGCATAGELYHSPEYVRRERLSACLMKAENPLLAEEAIQKLLSSRVQFPEKAKLAVHALPHQGTQLDRLWHAEESETRGIGFLQARKAMLTAIEEPVRATGRFVEVSHTPSMLVPRELSLTRLREAAALLQAEALLVYATRSELVTKYHPFTKDEVHALASVELFVMDVRTGAIPYAETFEAEHLERQSVSDLKISDTQRRAEREGTLKAVRQAGKALGEFFKPR